MRCHIGKISYKAKGGVARVDEEIDCEMCHLGRSTNNEIYLPDIRVSLLHAIIHERGFHYYIEAEADSNIRINGNPVSSARLEADDIITIGPYVISVMPETGVDKLTLDIVENKETSCELERLLARSKLSLAETGVSKRFWSWVLFISIALLFIVWPITAFYDDTLYEIAKDQPVSADMSWKSGEFAFAHTFFAKDCKACHQKAFQMVPDQACIACHGESHLHSDSKLFKIDMLDQTRCATCHKEHNGSNDLVRKDNGMCVGCHQDLHKMAPSSSLSKVSNFSTDHPEFKVTLLTDSGSWKSGKIRQSLAAIPKPEEQSNLKFSHEAHLARNGIKGPEGNQALSCASCHTPDPGGVGLKPINMETHCQQCHRLDFEPNFPDRQVPHGSPDKVSALLTDFYGNLALQGGFEDATAPDIVRKRRRPGIPLSKEERKQALQWVEEKVVDISAGLFEKRACVTCHSVSQSLEAYPPQWEIKPVYINSNWLDKARFTHESHKTMDCAECHDAKNSTTSKDVLIPGINNCRQCHAGKEEVNKLNSTCVDCHGFHSSTGKQ